MNEKNLRILTALVVVVFGVFTIWNIYDSGYDDGFHDGTRQGIAYQKCINEMGSSCTKEMVETVYYPHEKNILVYMYPITINLSFQNEGLVP